MITTSSTTVLPVDVFSPQSTDFQNLPLETLLGLSIDKMDQTQLTEYVKVLRAARTNAPTLRKHVEASNAADPVVQAVAKLPKKAKAATPKVDISGLLDD